jgi:hypothetical protein
VTEFKVPHLGQNSLDVYVINRGQDNIGILTTRGTVSAVSVSIDNAGSGLPTSQTLFTAIIGGTGGVVKFVTNGAGSITSAEIQAGGSGYVTASVNLSNGNLFSDAGLSGAVTTGASATGSLSITTSLNVGVGNTSEGLYFYSN